MAEVLECGADNAPRHIKIALSHHKLNPIYKQILQQEQIELLKLKPLNQAHSDVDLDYNTDAINCLFPENKFGFKLVEGIQLNGHH
jgi:hypothetical protein